MKERRNKLIYILILILMSFSLACQDRLIVLWDIEPPRFAAVMDTANIIDPSEIVNTQTIFQNDGNIEGMADIIMVIDNSGSMGEEISAVQSYINTLSNQMDGSGIDYRFVMISANSGAYGITVPPPLGTSSRFKHLNVNVGSWSALSDICNQYNKYSSFLRNGATLNFIIITDDDSNMTYSTFETNMKNFGKSKFTMHGIIGLDALNSNVSSIGKQYIIGIDATGGVELDITTPTSKWGSLFTQITNNIIDQMPETVYTLSSLPNIVDPGFPEGSMTITINGSPVSPLGNWEYNSSTNSIVFLNSNLLNSGGTIVVNYSILQQHPIETTYLLSETPYIADASQAETSFTVEINGYELNSQNNWVYNENSNSIIFINTSLLHNDDIVNINYQIQI